MNYVVYFELLRSLSLVSLLSGVAGARLYSLPFNLGEILRKGPDKVDTNLIGIERIIQISEGLNTV